MALDELYEQLRKLREDISEFSEYLEANETGTRQVLIDPLLRVLGWEVADPTQVRLEFGISKLDGGKKVADYVLIQDEKPVAVVEAKKLNTKNLEAAIGAALVEAVERGIKYILVTDGDQWRVYDVFKEAAIVDKLVVKFSVTSDQLCVSAVNALVIWRHNLANQRGLTVPKRLLFCEDDSPDPPPPPPPPPGGKTLPELRAKIKAREFPEGKRPTRVNFDGVPIELPKGTWKELYVAVAKHLVTTRRLQKNVIGVRESGRYVRSLVAADEESFKGAVDIGGGLWLQGNVSRIGAVDNSNFLLEVCDVDPATVRVHFDES